ncbi:cytosine permease [Latilactobacillus curvatus]|uniref:cytosine permease n=1 Tax=Latilactobacillus curvatus TaxID=28038 RepID=UPI0010ADB7A7|nr:cytosine permease [Latilactobacillus curvatus]MCP8858794.1 cytosine permease [Latilactobacillus curvatus]MCS6143529.1 cytosine permease [Latilactobacillus curvatus]TJY22541.1 cytosine permease [Latilactobacillus curvatus]WHQ77528.1 cytosine permease [Latilactobacillus curvatus]
MTKQQTIHAVSKDARTMGSWDLFATWIGANANNGTWFIGGIIAATGLIQGSTLLLVVGCLSYVLLALASYMGYQTGVGAMGLTRASFGVKGSVLPSIINVVQFIGWAAVNTYIAATSVSFIIKEIMGWSGNDAATNRMSLIVGILIMSVLHLISISLGEKSVRWIERIGIILVIILVTWESIIVFKIVPFKDLVAWRPASNLRLEFGKAVDILAAFNLAWVTAAADFSRFSKNKKAATGYSFLGANIGLFWFAFIGLTATIATAITLNHFDPNNADPSTIAAKLGLGVLALLVIVITSTTANAVNLMAAGSALTNIFPKFKLTPALWVVTLLATVMTFIPVYVASFLTTFETFLDSIGMFLGPEIAVFLVDYFIIRRRHYNVGALNEVAGPYWYTKGYHLTAMIAWVIGVVSYLVLNQFAIIHAYTGATFIAMGLTALVYWLMIQRKEKTI